MSEPKQEWVRSEFDGFEASLDVDGVPKGYVKIDGNGMYVAHIARRDYVFSDEAAAKKWVERVAMSVEFELYEAMAKAGAALYAVAQRVDAEPATIELCVFYGKVTAACDILVALKDTGVPLPDPDEESHPLEEAAPQT
jgi:hypothetical protein